jgi:hypothetical protein
VYEGKAVADLGFGVFIGEIVEMFEDEDFEKENVIVGRTKVVSKNKTMVDLTLRLWNALTIPEVFKQYQQKLMAIFR